MPSTTRLRLTVAAATLAFAVVLSGCTDPNPYRHDDTTGPEEDTQTEQVETESVEPDPEFSTLDVSSAAALLRHHRTNLELHDTLQSKADIDTEVRELSISLYTSNEGQIADLEALLEWWGEPIPTDEASTDIISDAEFRQFGRAAGDEAAALYLRYTLDLHRARSEVCEEVLVEGTSPELAEIAQDILTAQDLGTGNLRVLLERVDPGAEDDGEDADEDDGEGSPDSDGDGESED